MVCRPAFLSDLGRSSKASLASRLFEHDGHSAVPFVRIFIDLKIEGISIHWLCPFPNRPRFAPYHQATKADRLRFPDVAIAATAATHDLTVLTGNLRHFRPLGVPTHNPFDRLPEA
jgi:predicted nucleic acid-binding protein